MLPDWVHTFFAFVGRLPMAGQFCVVVAVIAAFVIVTYPLWRSALAVWRRLRRA